MREKKVVCACVVVWLQVCTVILCTFVIVRILGVFPERWIEMLRLLRDITLY